MTLTYTDIRGWDTEPLDSAIALLNSRLPELVELDDDLVAAKPPAAWMSRSAPLAARSHANLVTDMRGLVASVAGVRRALIDISDRIDTLRHRIGRLDEDAHHDGCVIGDDGEVLLAHGATPVPDAAVQLDLRNRVRSIIEEAERIDDDLAFLLQEVLDGDVDLTSTAETTLSAAENAGRVWGNIFHARLLDEFHVAVDTRRNGPVGAVTSWLAGLMGRDLNRGQTDALLSLGHRAKRFMEITNHANDVAEQRFSKEELANGRGDAFRHMYWNALLAREIGPEFAEQFTTAHEQKPGDARAHAMDLHNNQVGRDLAACDAYRSREDLAAAAMEKARSGGAIYFRDGELTLTDGATPTAPPSDVKRPQDVRPQWYVF